MIKIRDIGGNTPLHQFMHKLFWNRRLLLLSTHLIHPTHIHLRTLTRHKITMTLGHSLFGEVDEASVRFVNGEGGAYTCGLDLDSFGVDHFAGGYGGVEYEVCFGAFVEDDAVEFSFDLDGCVFAVVAVDWLVGNGYFGVREKR